MSAQQRLDAAETLAHNLLALPFAKIEGYVGGYWANDGEITLHRWQMQLYPKQIYCLPILDEENKTLRFAPWQWGQPLRTNRYGIPEPVIDVSNALLPQAMALVAVPLTGFSKEGCRMGMGGGWYDRSFDFRRQRPAPSWLVGVGFAIQETTALRPLPTLPALSISPTVSVSFGPWDVRMDAICTEQATFLCADQAKQAKNTLGHPPCN